MSYYRDKRIAEEASTPQPSSCAAIGCPRPWSVQVEGMRTCSAHAFKDWKQWPRITQELIDHDLDHARGIVGRVQARPAPVSPEEAREKLRALKIGTVPPKEWAYRLREQERAGKVLTVTQAEMWRRMLPERDPEPWIDKGER
jgi:hypothetical protein